MNPLRQLEASGQAVWFDYIRRSLMTGGQLQRMVDQDGLRGVTANPTIFEGIVKLRVGHAQRFLSVHGLVQNLFRVGRHLLRAGHYRVLRMRSFVVWDAVTCAS